MSKVEKSLQMSEEELMSRAVDSLILSRRYLFSDQYKHIVKIIEIALLFLGKELAKELAQETVTPTHIQ